MVAAVHFFATEADEIALLDHLGEPDRVRLFPWVPMAVGSPTFMGRAEALARRQVGILDPALGAVEIIVPWSASFEAPTRSGVLNKLNWGRMKPAPSQGIVDWNRTPALFWVRGETGDGVLTAGNLGSQADSMAAISDEYRKWVNRSMSWIRRKGQVVWEWTSAGGASPFDVELGMANTAYALPGAMEFLGEGGKGRKVLGA